MERLFDTVFETSLRLVLLLDELDTDSSSDHILVMDFMALYGKSFSISEKSLNGENPYMFCEIASRRSLIQETIKECVRKGYVLPTATEEGFLYRSTSKGRNLASSMKDAFAEKYRFFAASAIDACEGMTDEELISELNRKAQKAIERLTL